MLSLSFAALVRSQSSNASIWGRRPLNRIDRPASDAAPRYGICVLPNKRTFAMLVDDILPALGLPEATIKNRSIPRSYLMVHGARHPEDEVRILKEIVSVRLLAAINSVSAEVLPYVRPERKVLVVNILAVELRPNVKRDLLAESIHSLVPDPIVLFFVRDGAVFEISLAYKRSRIDAGPRTDIDGEVNSCPLYDLPVDAAFFQSVHWSELPRQDLFAVYRSWHERLEALKAARLTGEFALCATPAQKFHRRQLLAEYVRQFFNRKSACDHLTDELYADKRTSIQGKIEQIDAAIKSIRNQLRNMFNAEANEGARNVGERKVVLGSDEGSMTLPALP
jgi:Domain of unknown function (DUF4391)